MKYCCDRFKSYHEDNSLIIDGKVVVERYPTIKIVKLKDESTMWPFRYLFVLGLVKKRPPVISMAYCPFCGTELFNFYNSDQYLNEDGDLFL